MLIKNWMRKDVVTISSDMLASEAKKIFDSSNHRFLPVVDNGKLKGILARRDLWEAASFVAASQDANEMDFFNTKLKVKDIMVRMPITLEINDTVEKALVLGARFARSFFPVMDGDKVVGTVSDMDIYEAFYRILGIDERLAGVTFRLGKSYGSSAKIILENMLSNGIEIHSAFMLRMPDSDDRRFTVRFELSKMKRVLEIAKQEKYEIIETVSPELYHQNISGTIHGILK